MVKGKKYQESAKLIDRAKLYDTVEALDMVCQTSKAKFDETVEVHIKLGVDSRHADHVKCFYCVIKLCFIYKC